MDQATASYVHDFEEGHREQGDLLGGKGEPGRDDQARAAGPPSFTIDTKACRAYLTAGEPPRQLEAQIDSHLAALEARMGRGLGDPTDPLLVSVRSGAKSSMPGMMETVLDVGLNDVSVLGLARQSGSDRFAWDSYGASCRCSAPPSSVSTRACSPRS